MSIVQSIKLAIKSIAARKGRTFLTMLGIIIGLASVITLVSYAKGQTREIMQYYESMGSNQIQISASKWGAGGDKVFQSLYDYCLKLEDLVVGVTPSGSVYGTVQYGAKNSETMDQRPTVYLGSDQWSLCNNFTIGKGRDLCYMDIKNHTQVCVLGSKAAELFFDYANPLGKEITVCGVPLQVVGVYAQKDFSGNDYSLDNVIAVPYTLNQTLSLASKSFTDMSEFVVKAKSKDATNEAVTLLEVFLKGLIGDSQSGMSYGYYNVYSTNQGQQSADEATKGQQALLGGIAAISLLVGGIGIMNIMLVTVTERTREIGIRKAIGAERRTIVLQFLIEACMICGIGGILGILISYPATWIYCKQQLGYLVSPDPSIMALAGVVSVLLGILFGLYPAIKASGLQPVEALRAE